LEYFRPDSTEETLALLARFGSDAKVLAGGQSLMPLINMRLARPGVLLDINRISELSFLHDSGGTLSIGATVRHSMIERSDAVRHAMPLLWDATLLIGYPSIRARATFGGSMAHADPAAEYPSVAVALDAAIVVRSTRGERTLAARDFFKDILTTDLAEDELVTEVRVPGQSPSEGWAYEELATRPGDYATVGVIARVMLDPNGTCRSASVVCSAVGPTPIPATRAASLLVGALPSFALFDAAGAVAAEEVDPESDALASAAYKRKMTHVFVRRALDRAFQRAQVG
jgi:aerobic carbon-monoxide dehydrogenase medium subunit